MHPPRSHPQVDIIGKTATFGPLASRASIAHLAYFDYPLCLAVVVTQSQLLACEEWADRPLVALHRAVAGKYRLSPGNSSIELLLGRRRKCARRPVNLPSALGGRGRYVFQHLNSPNPQTGDLQISEAMATYWTNFAKYSDPSGQGLPQWPAFSDANPVVMHFAKTRMPGPSPAPTR